MPFEFSTAGRIIFGAGMLREAGNIAASMGRRALLVTGSDQERARPLLALLHEHGLETLTYAVAHEPDLATIETGTALAREEQCDCVIGFGGGAALDVAKAIAILITNPGELLDYLEIIGRGSALTKAPVALLAIPTTAGTGSEVTRNSVIISPERRVKVSLRSPLMLPAIALVDPELTYDLPPTITAATGVDALTQVIEPFVCTRANAMTDSLCREGMARAARSLRRVFENARARRESAMSCATAPPDIDAREDMAIASLFGGLALANAGLGAVHGIAGPLGGMITAPHGAVCAALLPHVVATNMRALCERRPQSPALPRYDEVGRLLTGSACANAGDAIAWLRQLVTDLGIPGLGAFGLKPGHIDELLDRAMAASSMRANPIELTRDELRSVVESAI